MRKEGEHERTVITHYGYAPAKKRCFREHQDCSSSVADRILISAFQSQQTPVHSFALSVSLFHMCSRAVTVGVMRARNQNLFSQPSLCCSAKEAAEGKL